jgi:hypothetical protein
MANRFEAPTGKVKPKTKVLVTTEDILKEKILRCVDVSLPHATSSTNEERVAYLVSVRILQGIQRVFDEM